MAEKNLIINNREITYIGIFRVDELFSTINQLITDKGYSKNEKKSEEMVTEKGRKIYVELRPKKNKTNYVDLTIKIKIYLDNITEIVETIDNEKRMFQKGNVRIVFDSWTETDHEHRWGIKPNVFFWKGLINKYIYKMPLEASFTDELMQDTAYIYAKLKTFFNTYKMETKTFVKEEDIKKAMEEEVRKEVGKEVSEEE